MTRMINGILVLGLVLCSITSIANTITLAPHERKMLTNHALFTVNATCTVHTEGSMHGKVNVVVLKNKGVINGTNLVSGQSTSLPVHNERRISVSAEAGAQISLVNLSSEALQAECLL